MTVWLVTMDSNKAVDGTKVFASYSGAKKWIKGRYLTEYLPFLLAEMQSFPNEPFYEPKHIAENIRKDLEEIDADGGLGCFAYIEKQEVIDD